MSFEGLINIKKALTALNPASIRQVSERPLEIALHSATPTGQDRIAAFLLRGLSPQRRRESADSLVCVAGGTTRSTYDLNIYDDTVPAPRGALIYHPDHARAMVDRALVTYPHLGVPLAKTFLPFRKPFVDRVVSKVSRENALFSVATALPDIVPSVIELPWALAEFASDTAFLTMNQVQMAFQIAAASDRPVGYLDQKSEIAMVIGSAFGWRALARQLVGKIPFGGGLIAKAGVAYAGTKVLGLSLNHLYAIGYTYTRAERDRLYSDAFRQGKRVAQRILAYLRPDVAARFAAQKAAATAVAEDQALAATNRF